MKDIKTTTLTATLRGIRPIMFDRYAGDNNTKLKTMEKLYTDPEGGIVLPVLNIFSLLTAQNTDSVAARFYGKLRRDMALGVNAFCEISPTGVEAEKMQDAPITDSTGRQFMETDDCIEIAQHVARTKKAGAAIPNPKERPMIPTGWHIRLDFTLHNNTFVTPTTLKTMVEQGGILGLGTFRPIYGRYVVIWE
jgi:hypothetical protein